ncbi:MAG: flagellar hook capping FlgD N-terminal domain-containing protein [bacterium]|nr:flagellar hook capping FlgD N-terminal domain-containing protein [bacterium]
MAEIGAITGATQAATTNIASIVNKDDFLKLLTTQLSYQDPFEPMENTEFVSQMAQFTSLEQMANLNKSFETFSNTLSLAMNMETTIAFLNKNVVANDTLNTGKTVEGKVTGIDYTGTVPSLILDVTGVGTRNIGLADVLKIVS